MGKSSDIASIEDAPSEQVLYFTSVPFLLFLKALTNRVSTLNEKYKL
jgi:hypothetical protein